MMKFVLISALLMIASGVSGCASLAYYQQAVAGQLELLSGRQPIDKVLLDEKISPTIRERIEVAQRITRFAENEIGLPVEGTFSSYVDIERRFVVWNVFAAGEFSLSLETYCFPIAGCVSYKGYFDREDALEFARKMKNDGYEVYVGGVEAYSTLGWFSDPLINTFINRRDERLASLIFHELAHKVVYVADDTIFNESFATAVERYCVQTWLISEGRRDLYLDYMASQTRRNEVLTLITGAAESLRMLYDQSENDTSMRVTKADIIANLRRSYIELKHSWSGGTEFEYWMESEINNAKLGAIGTYQDWVPGFMVLLEQSGSFDKFIARVKEIGQLPASERSAILAGLVASSPTELNRPE